MEVVRIFHPNAPAYRVKNLAQGADLFVYVGHGNGWPSRLRHLPGGHQERSRPRRCRSREALAQHRRLQGCRLAAREPQARARRGRHPLAPLVCLGQRFVGHAHPQPRRGHPARRQLRQRLPLDRRPRGVGAWLAAGRGHRRCPPPGGRHDGRGLHDPIPHHAQPAQRLDRPRPGLLRLRADPRRAHPYRPAIRSRATCGRSPAISTSAPPPGAARRPSRPDTTAPVVSNVRASQEKVTIACGQPPGTHLHAQRGRPLGHHRHLLHALRRRLPRDQGQACRPRRPAHLHLGTSRSGHRHLERPQRQRQVRSRRQATTST